MPLQTISNYVMLILQSGVAFQIANFCEFFVLLDKSCWLNNLCNVITSTDRSQSEWCIIIRKVMMKKMRFIWMSMYLAPKYYEGALFLRLQLETGPRFYVVNGQPSYAKVQPLAVQREYLHFSVILRPWVLVRPRELKPRPPALQSSALPTELILPLILHFSYACSVFTLESRTKPADTKDSWWWQFNSCCEGGK